MHRPSLALSIGLLIVLGTATPALALRCGNDVVSVGDDALTLTRKCGQPTMIDRVDDRVATRSYDSARGEYYTESVSDPYEIWTYNFGPQKFITRISIRRGRIEAIESGGYGY